jgi:hypothetical protein
MPRSCPLEGISSASQSNHSYSSQAHLLVLRGSLPPSIGHHEQLRIGTRTSLVQTTRTLLGVLAIAAWAHLLSVPHTLGASGDLEAWWTGLRTLDDAPSGGPLDRHAVGWRDPMKD